MPTYSISDSEWLVLRALWQDAPATAEAVVARLKDTTSWHERTIKTLLHRLVRKRVLAFQKEGKKYLYEPRVAPEACVREASRSFLERVFGGQATPAIVHLVEAGELTRDEVERLKRMLDETVKRKDRRR